MVKPTIGRVLWYYPVDYARTLGAQPNPVLVCYVHEDRLVNVGGFNELGHATIAAQFVPLLQDDDKPPTDNHYCTWMPHQVQQAAANAAKVAAT